MTLSAIFPDLTRDEVFRLETRRMWLRWPTKADAFALAPWVGKPSVALQTSTFTVGMSVDDVTARLMTMREANTHGRAMGFVMVLQEATDMAIGMVGAHLRDSGDVEIGYHLKPALWGQGLMTEAVSALANSVFDLAAVDSIMAGVKPDNLASRRVLEKSGFVADGGYEHESPLYGRYAVKRYRRARARISPLVSAMERRGQALPDLAFDLCGRI